MPEISVGTYNLYEVLTSDTPSPVLTMRDSSGNRIGPLMTDANTVAAAVYILRSRDGVTYNSDTNELFVGGTVPGLTLPTHRDAPGDSQPPQDLADFKARLPAAPTPDPSLLTIEWVRYYDLKLSPGMATGSVTLYNHQFRPVFHRSGISATKVASIAQVVHSRGRVYYDTSNGLLYSDQVRPG